MDKKLFIGLFFSFSVFTILGTLSHELGHYFVATYFGYKAEINYAATYWNDSDSGTPVSPQNSFLIRLGGPIQTIFTGTLGLILLFLFRKTFHDSKALSVGQWLMVFISLFWLRQTANCCMWLAGYFINGEFSSNGDEIQIANYLQLPSWTLATATAIVGIFILLVIVFKFIPLQQRLTFMASGLIGGIAGYTFWLVLFGKYIMP